MQHQWPAGRQGAADAHMKFFVYALQSLKDKEMYIGISANPDMRLIAHNKGMTPSTKSRRPFVLIYTEACRDRFQARLREKKLKSGSGREFLKQFTRP